MADETSHKFKDDELDAEQLPAHQRDRDADAANLFRNRQVAATDPGDEKVAIPGEVPSDRSKATDMCFCWLVNCVEQKRISACWDSGKKNLADHFTQSIMIHLSITGALDQPV